MQKQTKAQKLKYLKDEEKKYEEKLDFLYKHFHGVRHENSLSEMRYTTIKVYEGHLVSIKEEIKQLEENEEESKIS